jgi:uncharacterized lipoprotein
MYLLLKLDEDYYMIKVGLAIILMLSLLGCAKPQLVIYQYMPVTKEKADGQLSVENFQYTPKKEGFASDQIRNTAMGGGVLLPESVGEHVANAVRREFLRAGISLRKGACKMSGIVNDLVIDDLGYSVTYISEFRYIIKQNESKVIFDKTFSTQVSSTKFPMRLADLSKSISDNIEKVMSDSDFKNTLVKYCH